jgi:hypothetical protein
VQSAIKSDTVTVVQLAVVLKNDTLELKDNNQLKSKMNPQIQKQVLSHENNRAKTDCFLQDADKD